MRAFFAEKYLPYVRHSLKSKTVAEYERLYSHCLDRYFGSRLLQDITLADIEAFHIKQSKAGKVQANRALALLSAIMGRAVRHGLLTVNPCREVRRNKETPKERYLSPDECQRLILACDLDDSEGAAFIKLVLFTGARPSELLAARKEDIDGDMLRLQDSKTGARTIYLSEAAQEVIGYVPFAKGLDYRRAWERLRVYAGIDDARLYDLRHTFASSALAAGIDLGTIGQLLGHRKLQTTLRYAHLSKDKALDAARRASERMTS